MVVGKGDPAVVHFARYSFDISHIAMPVIENSRTVTEASGRAQATEALEDVVCGACSSGERSFETELAGFQFHRCLRCRLLYMSPRPASSTLGALYDERYFSSDDPNIGYPVYWEDRTSLKDKASRLLRRVENYVTPGRLLDVGCAYGFTLDVARERGWAIEGVEPARAVAEQTAERLGVAIHSDLLGAGLPSKRFDALSLWDVIEHIPDLSGALREIRHVLKRGGILSVVTPDEESLAARLLGDRWEEKRKMPEHIYLFGKSSLSSLLSAAGFEVLEWGTVGKLMPIREACERVASALPGACGPLLRLVGASRLGNRALYLDPRWKLALLARNSGD